MTWKAVFAAVLLSLAPAVASARVTCTLSSTGVAFGVFSSSQVRSNGTLTIYCTGTGNSNYTVSLSTGASGTYSSRRMNYGTNILSYNLFTDSTYTAIWGNGTGGSATVSGSISMKGQPSITINLTIYGQVPSQTSPAPGIYLDTITATMTYS